MHTHGTLQWGGRQQAYFFEGALGNPILQSCLREDGAWCPPEVTLLPSPQERPRDTMVGRAFAVFIGPCPFPVSDACGAYANTDFYNGRTFAA